MFNTRSGRDTKLFTLQPNIRTELKWSENAGHVFKEKDFVLILDLKNNDGYPKMGQINHIEKDG